MMLAAQVVESKKPWKIHEVPTLGTDLNQHDLLVKGASLCHTEGMVTRGIMGAQLPCITSHEGPPEFHVGDRVLCNLTYHRRRVCADCIGPERDQQYCANEVVDGREACLWPDNVSFEPAAPLACAGITISGLKAREAVALVGAGGGLGRLDVQFAKAKGLHVIAIDARDEGLQLAKDCGADIVIDAREGKEKVVEEVQKVTERQGVDASLNISAVTRMHGTLVLIAQPTNVSIHGSSTECQRMLEVVSKSRIKVPKAVELAHLGKIQGKHVIVIDQQAIEGGKRSGKRMVLATASWSAPRATNSYH
ncbi:hypothetical protein BJ875DRAFT_527398 [Amylocarpus encephaloides]|uniref:Alcohol dehydrogenase-like C-terminal domain-containing protein n=1 Tax=Amylocarpus encephaloides TaxID=45428 RepID=A0A9P7YLV4_9HELO|nr:hypothetical protein BJ875DRAFT_527398 [Amylocarpus encephaloides]